MDLPLNHKSQQLLALLLTIPPDFASAEALLKQENFSPEDITKVAICYAEECNYNVGDHLLENADKPVDLSAIVLPVGVIPNLHSTYLYEVIRFLLPHGIAVNAVYEAEYCTYNLMDALLFVDNEYVAADTLLLLLENGGDSNLAIDGESIFEQVDFEIWFGAVEQDIRWKYEAWLHLWMVLLAYGGRSNRRDPAVQVFREYGSNEIFDLRKLKDHRNYYVGLSTRDDQRTIHIYDKKTFWEVARA